MLHRLQSPKASHVTMAGYIGEGDGVGWGRWRHCLTDEYYHYH